jgi:hypothetical protein
MTMEITKIKDVAILAAFLLLMILCAYKFAHSQQSYAYYECSNIPNTFIKFEAPDTIKKRISVFDTFSCKALPQIVFELPEGANVLYLHERKEIRVKFFQSVKSKMFDMKELR